MTAQAVAHRSCAEIAKHEQAQLVKESAICAMTRARRAVRTRGDIRARTRRRLAPAGGRSANAARQLRPGSEWRLSATQLR